MDIVTSYPGDVGVWSLNHTSTASQLMFAHPLVSVLIITIALTTAICLHPHASTQL